MSAETKTVDDLELLEAVLDRVATNVSMLIDREIEVADVAAERVKERPAGTGQVHISFKLAYQSEGVAQGHGCLLLPLPEAIAMACFLMMLPDSEVDAHRSDDTLDESMKEAMTELGGFMASAMEEALHVYAPELKVAARGCQGVRADVRPAFPYEEGQQLLVARAQVQLHGGSPFELLLMQPPALV